MHPRRIVPVLAVLAVGGALAWYGGRTAAPGPAGPGPASPPASAPGLGSVDARGMHGGHGEEAADPFSGPWRPEPVRTRAIPRYEVVPAVARTPAPVILTSTVRAPVLSIAKNAREGGAVEKGEVLVRLNPEGWEKALAAARKAGDAKRVAECEEALAGMEIRAPVSGIVHRNRAELGSLPPVSRGKGLPLVVLYDWKELRYEGRTPEVLAPLLAPGAVVGVRIAKDEGTGAEVESLDPPGEDGKRRVVVRPTAKPVTAPEPGSEAEILVPTVTQEILVVPSAAVKTAGGRSWVRVVPTAGEPVETEIGVGQAFPGDGMVEVLKGLGRFQSVAVPHRE